MPNSSWNDRTELIPTCTCSTDATSPATPFWVHPLNVYCQGRPEPRCLWLIRHSSLRWFHHRMSSPGYNKSVTFKNWYDKASRPLPPITKGQVVGLQTDKGHDRIGVISGTASEPRSYLVIAGNSSYRRNRQHILPVNEPAPPPYYPDCTSVLPSVSSGIDPPTPVQPTSGAAALPVAAPALQSPFITRNVGSISIWFITGNVGSISVTPKPPALSPVGKHGLYRTRAGRVCKPTVKYSGYV